MSSCQPTFRTCSVNSAAVTKFDNKNDFSVSGQMASNGIEFKIAYSPIKHLACIVQASAGASLSAEGGLVYYTSLFKKLKFETGITGGKSGCHSTDKADNSFWYDKSISWDANNGADKYAAHSALGFCNDKFYFGLGCKVTYLDFYSYEYKYFQEKFYSASTKYLEYRVDVPNQYPQGWIFQPFVLMSVYTGPVQLFFQGGYLNATGFKIKATKTYGYNSNRPQVNYTESLHMLNEYLSAGVIFKINTSKSKKQ